MANLVLIKDETKDNLREITYFTGCDKKPDLRICKEKIEKSSVFEENLKIKRQLEENPVSRVNNTSPSDEMYEGRIKYKKLFNERGFPVVLPKYKNHFDTWYQYPFYGKVNFSGAPIIPNVPDDKKRKLNAPEVTINLAPLVYDESSAEGVPKALTPVALAFVNFKRLFNKRAKGYFKKVGTEDIFVPVDSAHLSRIEATKGWVSIYDAYRAHLDTIYGEFNSKYLQGLGSSPKIKDIEDFVELLKLHIQETRSPFTFVGFVESKYNNIYTTGLAIDIYDGDPASDQEKSDFMNDLNFPLFSRIAKKHGFRVDPNCPWRIIADLGSPYFWDINAQLPSSGEGRYRHASTVAIDPVTKDALKDKKGNKIVTNPSVKEVGDLLKNMFPGGFHDLIDNIFAPVHQCGWLYDTREFAYHLINFYARFAKQNPSYSTKSISSSVIKKGKFYEKFTEVAINKRELYNGLTVDDLDNLKNLETGEYNVTSARKIAIENLNFYIDIRNMERAEPLSRRQLRKLKKKAGQIINYGVQLWLSDSKKVSERDNWVAEAVKLVEYSFGATAASFQSIDKKLTVAQEDDIFIFKAGGGLGVGMPPMKDLNYDFYLNNRVELVELKTNAVDQDFGLLAPFTPSNTLGAIFWPASGKTATGAYNYIDLSPDKNYTISITVKNIGVTDWSGKENDGYVLFAVDSDAKKLLGAQKSDTVSPWDKYRFVGAAEEKRRIQSGDSVFLPLDTIIGPGQDVTFTFNIFPGLLTNPAGKKKNNFLIPTFRMAYFKKGAGALKFGPEIKLPCRIPCYTMP